MNIEYLFETDLFEQGMAAEAIESVIYRTELNGQRVQSFELISGAVVATDETFWKLGTVSFT